MFSHQLGQVVPSLLLSVGLTSGLTVTVSPAMLEIIDQAELVSINYAHSALSSSLKVNHLLAGLSSKNEILIDGKAVTLKHGYPVAKVSELEKVATFGTQTLVNNTDNTVTIWSMYKSYCFKYSESTLVGNTINSAKISDVSFAPDEVCPS